MDDRKTILSFLGSKAYFQGRLLLASGRVDILKTIFFATNKIWPANRFTTEFLDQKTAHEFPRWVFSEEKGPA